MDEVIPAITKAGFLCPKLVRLPFIDLSPVPVFFAFKD
jgi:hypothetical protein